MAFLWRNCTMHIVARSENGPFAIIDDATIIYTIPDFGVAVDFTRNTLKQQMRKTDRLEIWHRYKLGTRAIGFHAEGTELHGYHISPQENGKNNGRTTSCDNLGSVWKHCLNTAGGRPFKIILTFWE